MKKKLKNNNNQKQVIYLISSPLSVRDYERFGISNWINANWKVKVFDITKFYLNPDYILSNIELEKLNNFTNELKKGKPFQYIKGETEFYGYKFYVNSDVLIPRIETEGLVDWILSDNSQLKKTVIDFCSGSGCICVTIKMKRKKWDVFALEKSQKAIELAKRNSSRHSVKINYIHADIFSSNE